MNALLLFVIETAVAIAFKVGVGDLISKLFAHTDILFCLLQAARAISAFFSEAFANSIYNFFIFIEDDFHCLSLFNAVD